VKTLAGRMIATVAHGEDGSVEVLAARVPRDVWDLIAKDMYYVRSEEDMEGLCDFGGERFRGWAVGSGKVEKILREEAERRATAIEREEAEILMSRDKKADEDRRRAKEERERLERVVAEVREAFEYAKVPHGMNSIEGERIDNPLDPQNIYGGGEWFVIQKNKIWYVKNNGMDGDDWSRNNVETGGAGAIGCYVKFDEKLAAKIRSLKHSDEDVAIDYADAMTRRIERLIEGR